MAEYFPFFLVFGIITALLVIYSSCVAGRNKDHEVAWLKRSRRIRMPEDAFHMPAHDLQLCVSCECVHLADMCPRCGSEVVLPLSRVVKSTRGFEFPIKKDEKPDNVIQLPLAKPGGMLS